MRIKKALLLVVAFALVAGCHNKATQNGSSPLPDSVAPLNISVGKSFEGWKESVGDNGTFYSSPDDQILIFVTKGDPKPLQETVDQLKNSNVPEFSIDKVEDTTVGGKTGKVMDITHSGEPGMKFQVHFVEAGNQTVRVGIILPTEQQSFLTEADKWPAFLEGVSFPEE